MARPSIYTPKLAYQICKRIAKGQSLRSICRNKSFPDASTIHLWLLSGKHEGFFEQYAHARQQQVEAMADQIREVADNADSTSYNAARLQVDTMKWLMSKVAPRQYGERTQLAHTDADGGPLVIRCEGMPSLPVLGSQPPKALT